MGKARLNQPPRVALALSERLAEPKGSSSSKPIWPLLRQVKPQQALAPLFRGNPRSWHRPNH